MLLIYLDMFLSWQHLIFLSLMCSSCHIESIINTLLLYKTEVCPSVVHIYHVKIPFVLCAKPCRIPPPIPCHWWHDIINSIIHVTKLSQINITHNDQFDTKVLLFEHVHFCFQSCSMTCWSTAQCFCTFFFTEIDV